jgi:flagellar biosynthetic protein FliP
LIPGGLDLGAEGGASPLQILALLTVLAVLPGIILMVTAFPRILIVLGFVRNALGTPTFPPNQVLVGIALFLTLFVMGPTFTKVNTIALQPFLDGELEQEQALERGLEPIRTFMFKQTDDEDLALFVNLAKMPRPETRADVPTRVLVPAFILSELKTAFQIGFLIYLPFLVIDMVVSSILMSMGMMMLPPIVISLPFKVLLFVLVDGWHLVVEGLVNSFQP